MATLDRQIPSPDTYFCEPWSSFVSAAKLRFVDSSSSDLRRKEPRCRVERAERLGYRALEDFCLVVCHVCNQVVTPHGILAHYEKRHGSPAPPRSLTVPMKPKAPAAAPAPPPVAPGPGETLTFRVPKDFPHSRFSKAPLAVYPPKGARNKACVSLPVVNLEKMPCLGHADSAAHLRLTAASASSSSSSSASLKPPSLGATAHQRPTPSPEGRPGPARSPLDRRLSSTPSPSAADCRPPPSEKKHQNGTKTSSPSQRRLSGRVFDPNKHCGVQDPETKRPCTRSLTCKTHSLTYRRAVSGRTKHFDVLLAEHKGRAKVNEGAKEKGAPTAWKEGSSHSITATGEASSPAKPHCPNGRPLSTLKLRLANAHIPRVPSSISGPLAPAPAPPAVPNPEPSPRGSGAGDGGRLSSDEGDAETPEDTARPAFHSSNRHPQPLGVCVFSSRLMGRGHYVFDRRWDRMRLALQSTVEKHLNAQMWRKVPLAPESLVSLSSSGTSPDASPQTPSPVTASHLRPPSNSFSRPAAFPPGASVAGALGIRDAPRLVAPVSSLVKARNGTHRANRPSKESEDCVAGSRRRKNSSHPSSSSSSFSSLPLTVDNVRRNGASCHPTLHASGRAAGRKSGGGSGLWSGGEHWSSRPEGPQSHNSSSSREHGTAGVPYSSIREAAFAPSRPLASPSGPLAYGGGAEGRKRRSPGSYQGKMSKLSRPGGLEGLFGNGSDTAEILASGPESQRPGKSHH
ncbi:atxn7l1 [Pungitius sinensis]